MNLKAFKAHIGKSAKYIFKKFNIIINYYNIYVIIINYHNTLL